MTSTPTNGPVHATVSAGTPQALSLPTRGSWKVGEIVKLKPPDGEWPEELEELGGADAEVVRIVYALQLGSAERSGSGMKHTSHIQASAIVRLPWGREVRLLPGYEGIEWERTAKESPTHSGDRAFT